MKYANLLSSFGLLCFFACGSGRPPSIASYFSAAPAIDTIHIQLGTAPGNPLDTIPYPEFTAALDTALRPQFIYPLDSIDTQLLGHWNRSLDDNHTAYLLEVHQHWFEFKYLLIYDQAKGEFTQLVPAAQFYGGEGGQVRTRSLLFDLDNHAPAKLITRQSEHALEITDGNLQDQYFEGVRMKIWNENQFENAAPDAAQNHIVHQSTIPQTTPAPPEKDTSA